jgi:hypothetical protein
MNTIKTLLGLELGLALDAVERLQGLTQTKATVNRVIAESSYAMGLKRAMDLISNPCCRCMITKAGAGCVPEMGDCIL